MSTPLRWLVVFGAVLAVASGPANAETILNFASNPASPGLPELVWNGTTLQEGAGSLSNGDGNLGTGPGATAPGLILAVPFIIPLVPGSQISGITTTFFDATLDITVGLVAPVGIAGNALNLGGLLIQPLGPGAFEVRSSNILGGNLLLLAGTIDDAVITGLAGSGTAGVLSATVTYTGGLIYNAMIANNYDVVGDFSWSMIDIAPTLAINTAGNKRLKPFTANATGLFSAPILEVPEPASMSLLALGGAALLLRRRR